MSTRPPIFHPNLPPSNALCPAAQSPRPLQLLPPLPLRLLTFLHLLDCSSSLSFGEGFSSLSCEASSRSYLHFLPGNLCCTVRCTDASYVLISNPSFPSSGTWGLPGPQLQTIPKGALPCCGPPLASPALPLCSSHPWEQPQGYRSPIRYLSPPLPQFFLTVSPSYIESMSYEFYLL